MKNWDTVEPDEVKLLSDVINDHFTRGRNGHKIRHVTLHHMGGIGDAEQCRRWWTTRAASAHYAISPEGRIGQVVWDRDTAWANANAISNYETIAIEHSNSGGPDQDWPISEKTLEAGAHLVAALCKFYKLGRPVSGINVRYHTYESTVGTECPYHLRPGHKYNAQYIARARYWYDEMTAPKPLSKEDSMTPAQWEVVKENNSLLREIRYQLCGSQQPNKFPGLPQSGNRTLFDTTAAVAAAVDVPGAFDIKEKK